MAQGKLKVKTRLPSNIKKQSQKKGTAATKRLNRPNKPKKQKMREMQKLKQVVTKALNKSVEEEIRARADSTRKNLSKAQEAVAKFNQQAGTS